MNERGEYWYDKNWLRLTVLLCLAFAAIQLGRTYLKKIQEPLNDTPTYHVISSGFIEPGKQASLRVSARMLDSKEIIDVQVEDITIEGQPIHFNTTGLGPTMVQMDVPHALPEKTSVVLSLRSQGDSNRQVSLPLSLARPSENFSAVAEEDSISEISSTFRVDVLPDELVMGMTNSVFVLVRLPDGSPAPNAHVQVAYPGGKTEGKTTAWGLFEFQLSDPQPAFELGVKVNQGQYDSTESLRSYGKGLQLTPKSPVVAIGHPQTVEIKTREESTPLFCDLRRGSVWRKSWTTHSQKHHVAISLPGLDFGLYQLQCTRHDLKSGEAVATTPIVVSNESTHNALRTLILDNKVWYKTSVPEQAGGSVSDNQTHRFWIESLREPPYGGDLPRAFTAEKDKEERLQLRKAELRSFIPFVLLLLLMVVAWTTELNLRRRAQSRAHFTALATEDSLGDLGIAATAEELALVPYLHSRAVLFGSVSVGSTVLNIALFNHAATILS